MDKGAIFGDSGCGRSYSEDIFAHSQNSWNGPDPESAGLSLRSARNLAINKLKRLGLESSPEAEKRDPLVLADEMAGPFESAALQEETDQLVAAIQSLPERCRQVMTVKKIYGLTQKEGAAKLGISEHTVEAQIGIGMRKCTAFFQQRGYKTRNSR